MAGGLFEWLTLFWLLSLSGWIAALLVFHAVASGQLQVSWLRLLPPEGGEVDIEMGAQPVRLVDQGLVFPWAHRNAMQTGTPS